MKFTYVKLPKAGLGNKLILWSIGYLHSKDTNSLFINSSWFYFNIGPWIRNEKSKRLYFTSFKNRPLSIIICSVFFQIFSNFSFIKSNKNITIFQFIEEYNLFFKLNYSKRFEIKEALLKILSERTLRSYKKLTSPDIGVHIRRGDFKFGSNLTDIDFFYHKIIEIREKYGNSLSVTIFSDGSHEDLKTLLSIGNVKISDNSEDILDLFQLSMSRYCILSKNSTFSYWGAFFSNGKIFI
jgi:hypothetical protein